MKKYLLALHIFRRDLRLQDNSALIDALKLSEAVIPCFIFDKRQIENNNYKSDNCIQFMVHSLQELDKELKKKNGNWQWAASTGCDAQPYFRIFNPWLQQQKFDSDCLYIKNWIPELVKLAPKIVHNQDKMKTTNYTRAIVDHAIESQKARIMYKMID